MFLRNTHCASYRFNCRQVHIKNTKIPGLYLKTSEIAYSERAGTSIYNHIPTAQEFRSHKVCENFSWFQMPHRILPSDAQNLNKED